VPLAGGALLLSFWLGRREELAPELESEPMPDPPGARPLVATPEPMATGTL
jgi:hypothetical protein